MSPFCIVDVCRRPHIAGKAVNTGGMDMEKKRGKKKGHILINILFLFVLAVFAVSLWQVFTIFREYRKGADSYAKLQVYAVREEKNSSEEETDGSVTEEAGEFPIIQVDFESLKKVNPETVGWLYIPALEVEYPVVQGKDNEYYITHTFQKEKNSAGTIFADYRAAADFSDYNTLVYGHNMKNGSMFGKLKNFIRDAGLCENNPYFYMYTPEGCYQYMIISYYVTEDGSSTYSMPRNQDEYDTYKKNIMRRTSYKCKEEIPTEKPLMTLSTCYGKAGTTQRFVVHGIQKQFKDSDGGSASDPDKN